MPLSREEDFLRNTSISLFTPKLPPRKRNEIKKMISVTSDIFGEKPMLYKCLSLYSVYFNVSSINLKENK